MKNLIIIITVLFSFSSNIYSQGFLDRVRNKVADKIEKTAGDAIEDKIDEEFEEADAKRQHRRDSIEKANPHKKRDHSGLLNMIGGAYLEGSYNFDSEFTVTTKIYNKKGRLEDVSDATFMIKKGKRQFAVKSKDEDNKGQSIVIFDSEKNKMMTLIEDDDGNKSGFALTINPNNYKSLINAADEYNDDTKITKTGRTKTILGFKCDEYKVEEKKTTTYNWLTNDSFFSSFNDYMNFYETDEVKNSKNYKKYEVFKNSYPMETMVVHKNGEKTKTTVTNISKSINVTIDASSFNQSR